jgi:hypothetical protein
MEIDREKNRIALERIAFIQMRLCGFVTHSIFPDSAPWSRWSGIIE